MVAWEFCYQILGSPTVTFYPGIWNVTETSSNSNYALVQSNTIIYDPRNTTCQIFNLSDTEQFTAPAGSVVGLFSNVHTQLFRTKDNNSITTYQFSGNQSNVSATNIGDVNYNIAIRVHLGK